MTARSLKARAVDLLSRREHSRHELARKLARHTTPCETDQLEQLLDELERENWLSDERFAQSLVHRQAGKKGVALIEQELRQHRVSEQVISSCCHQLHETELERCQAVWQAKYPEGPIDARSYARHYRFLGSRGFSPDCIRRVLGSVPYT